MTHLLQHCPISEETRLHFSRTLDGIKHSLKQFYNEPWLEHYAAFEQRLSQDTDFRFWFTVGWTLLTLFIAWKSWSLLVTKKMNK